ncbi:thiamine-phosphate kinase [Altericroceibacterium endophyticum]|uniref:Thiamine-monophosphate kinase n=1 Tax=Altericroceibacterium endophyticum TaxID=1808508 RepID=A0A6I4T2G8_9SPHN|nr:thiamine-phosphate kinase [Altericroceibacterium endophyticum]MXO64180.1 thiamine-phosphate kinase [Altericroceibacterium endophyticum]
MTGEAAFINAMRALATHPAARGLADDTAVLPFGGEVLILTHDMMVEGVHFLLQQDPADIAWKLVATNLSDLAAKGAEPVGVLLGHMLGHGDDRFAAGLKEVLERYNVPLLGGDTVSAPEPGGRSMGLTAIGRATCVPVPSRSGAKPRDDIYVTGPLGAAMMGLEALQSAASTPETESAPDDSSSGSDAYRRPQPRLAEGRALAPLVTAMMDISDGLLLDAFRMGTASNVSLHINAQQVPIAAPEDRRQDALRWGDDYELLFTLPAGSTPPVPATQIGRVTPYVQGPVWLDDRAMTQPDGLGFSHI